MGPIEQRTHTAPIETLPQSEAAVKTELYQELLASAHTASEHMAHVDPEFKRADIGNVRCYEYQEQSGTFRITQKDMLLWTIPGDRFDLIEKGFLGFDGSIYGTMPGTVIIVERASSDLSKQDIIRLNDGVLALQQAN